MFYNTRKMTFRTFWTGLAVFVFFLLSFPTFSQEKEITELQAFLNSSENLNSGSDHQEKEDIRRLVFGSPSTILISPLGTKTFGEGTPEKAEVNIQNFQYLESSPDFQNVKLFVINIEQQSDQNINLNYSILDSMESLKYILVRCSYDCNPEQIQQLFPLFFQKGRIFYTISIPQ